MFVLTVVGGLVDCLCDCCVLCWVVFHRLVGWLVCNCLVVVVGCWLLCVVLVGLFVV